MPDPELSRPDALRAHEPSDAVRGHELPSAVRGEAPDPVRDAPNAVSGHEAAGPGAVRDPSAAGSDLRPVRQVGRAGVLAAVALGGIAGACARYGASLLWPAQTGGFPWATFWVNVTGCAAMGILMVVITEVVAPHPLIRPFLGTGVLGGYTTFSTYIVDAQLLLDAGRAATALLYLAATLTAALLAVQASATVTRRLTAPLRLRGGDGARR